jgi:hypothetical protein
MKNVICVRGFTVREVKAETLDIDESLSAKNQ